ncbi:MAG: right-handed parallel beta-helix repeat-containing protein [Verrucomicrobia bacterium]|nr:right-handed parallel beta-helix repeat-containing protein [Verrucomicrobiota bacterium]
MKSKRTKCSVRPWASRWLALTLLSGALDHAVRAAEFYVAIDGRDTWSGLHPTPTADRTDGPFASLERARDAVRALERMGAEPVPVTVHVGAGRYELRAPFELAEPDSGSARAPVVYRAAGGAPVVLSGGRQIYGFQKLAEAQVLERLPAEARGHVYVADLPGQGFSDYGEVTTAGRRLELFFAEQPMTLARWPNQGFIKILEVTGGDPMTVHGLRGDRIGKFTCAEDRLGRWVGEPEGWLHGYWFWDWSDAYQRIQTIDPDRRLFELAEPYHGYGYRNGQRFYALNLLSELDQPGEWYLDRQTGGLYFWPPQPIDSASVVLSLLPTAVTMKDVAWVRLEGFTFEATRGTAIRLDGGEHGEIRGCRIRNTGGWGVTVNGGRGHGVVSCDLEQTAEGGISLQGGDRRTLTPCGHFALNNRIGQFGRVYRTYRPAVGVGGVGVRVAHNLLADGPHNAIQLGGNDHLIEFNEIHHVCYETGDVGAFYMGRDWTARGTVIRHNYFHDIRGPGLHGAMAVYLDDSASGITIYGNLFVRSGRSAFIGGGRDNLVENNLFIDCEPAVHVDARGLGWMKYHVEGDGTLPQRLAEMPYREHPWNAKYPQLVGILDDQPGAPKGNRVVRNLRVGGRWLDLEKAAAPFVEFTDNLVEQDPGLMDVAAGDYRLREGSPAHKLGFQPIPFERIGLYRDAWRRRLP